MLGVISVPALGCANALRREGDLLGGQLGLDGVVHVGGTPQQQAAGGEQDRGGEAAVASVKRELRRIVMPPDRCGPVLSVRCV